MEQFRDINPFALPGRPASQTSLAHAQDRWLYLVSSGYAQGKFITADQVYGRANTHIPDNIVRSRELHADYWRRNWHKRVVRLTEESCPKSP